MATPISKPLQVGAGLTVAASVIAGINDLERKRLKLQRLRKHLDLEGKLTKYQNQLDDLQVAKSRLQDNLKLIESDIYVQNEKMYAVKDVKYDQNTKFIVVLGITGDGKSTLCNRLYGDKSDEGDEGPFKTDTSVNSGMLC